MIDEGKEDYKKLEKTWDDIQSINVNKLKVSDIPKIVKLSKEIEDDIKTAKSLVNKYSAKIKTVKSDINGLNKDVRDFKNSIEADLDYLSGFFDLSSGQLKNIGSDIVKAQMSRYLGNSYVLANRILEYGQNIRKSQGNKEGSKSMDRAKGERVYFPSQNYPSFWLQKSHFNMADDSFSVDLTDISSDPNIIDVPAVLASTINTGELQLDIDGTLDLRDKSSERFTLAVDTSGMSADLSDELANLEIAEFDSKLSISGDVALAADGTFTGNTRITLTEIKSKIKEDPTLLGKILKDILAKTNRIRISAGFTITEEKGLSMKISTNLNSLLSNAFNGIINDLKEDATKKTKAFLDEKTGPYLKDLEKYKDDIQAKLGDLNSTFADLKKYQDQFEKKKAELEKKKKDLEKSTTGAVEDAVKDLIPKKLF
jgi:uncharacterized protein (TIGR03545 family)